MYAAADLAATGIPRRIQFLGFPLISASYREVADWIIDSAQSRSKVSVVMHVNFYNYYLAHESPAVREQVRDGCHLLLDGIGMKVGAWIRGHGWREDVNGTDLFPLVMQRAARRNARIFFLGGTAAVLQRTISVCRERYPGLEVCGWRAGYFRDQDAEAIVAGIKEAEPHVLIVSRGSSMQAEFLLRYRRQFGASVVWNVGGLFDFVSGAKPRAPEWMRRLRLEWLFRLLREPGRLWRRTFVVAPWFLVHVLVRDADG